jgi:hypothetical protein
MAWSDRLVLGVLMAINMAGPVVLLLLLRRRTRHWGTAFARTAVVAPIAAFLLTGGVAWLVTYLRVVVRGDTSIPVRIGVSVPQYLWSTFGMCGIYGVIFAGTGFGMSLPLVGAWRLAHPASFGRLVRAGQSRPRSAVEQDYDDTTAAEPVVAPDPRRQNEMDC